MAAKEKQSTGLFDYCKKAVVMKQIKIVSSQRSPKKKLLKEKLQTSEKISSNIL